MHFPRLIPCLAIGAAVAACLPVHALGLGGGPASVALGQPLEFVVPVRLEPEDTGVPECVQAEVFVGDQRPVPATVRVRGSGAGTAIRVGTAVAIDEPVVVVQLSAGCASKIQRRYVVFADPPAQPLASAPVPLAMTVQTADPTPPDSPPAPTTPARAAGTAAPASADAASRSATESGAQPSTRTPRAAAGAARVRTARGTLQRPARHARATRSRELPRAPAPVRVAEAPREETQPRLRLEAVEPMAGTAAAVQSEPGEQVIEEAIRAVAAAASAAREAAEAASASAARIAALEGQVDQLRSERRANQSEIERLRAVAGQAMPQLWWLWPLLGLAALLAAFSAWLLWRLHGVQRAQEVAWARASEAVRSQAEPTQRETSPLPLVHSVISAPMPLSATLGSETAPIPHEITAAGLRTGVLEASLAPAVPTASTRTMPMPTAARPEKPRDVSIEELIDVDQQAEFFIALGQYHAAIDLLVAHLRDTGGGSPLTYLKLLEIYQRVGEAEAYERTRSRFNQRYNAYAPQWGADLGSGKVLEEYVAVMPRLVAAWPRPMDAMAELEALLFRKSRGELFDLPAYRDVLFLYSIARDHLERESGEPERVDLLLPLDARAAAMAIGSSQASSDLPSDDHPTAPLDLDLTPPPRTRESIFGELLQPSTKPPRRH